MKLWIYIQLTFLASLLLFNTSALSQDRDCANDFQSFSNSLIQKKPSKFVYKSDAEEYYGLILKQEILLRHFKNEQSGQFQFSTQVIGVEVGLSPEAKQENERKLSKLNQQEIEKYNHEIKSLIQGWGDKMWHASAQTTMVCDYESPQTLTTYIQKMREEVPTATFWDNFMNDCNCKRVKAVINKKDVVFNEKGKSLTIKLTRQE